MAKEITIESLYTLLSGFITRQEAFNTKQEAFNSRLEDRLDGFQEEEKANHNLSHRMIMQAFEAISDIKSDIDAKDESWLRSKR